MNKIESEWGGMSDESLESNRKSASITGDLVSRCPPTSSKDRDGAIVYRSGSADAHSITIRQGVFQ